MDHNARDTFIGQSEGEHSVSGPMLFLLALPLAFALALWFRHVDVHYGGDRVVYQQMANDPTHFTTGNWGYRLLTPWIVHLLPFPHDLSFWLMTVLGMTGAATVLALLCRDAGLTLRAIYAVAPLFLLAFGARFELDDYRLVDPLALLGTVLTFWLLARQRLLAAGVCVLLTEFDKEWGLFLTVPMAVVLGLHYLRERRFNWQAALVGVLAPLLTFWLTRHWPGFGNGATQDNPLSALEDLINGRSGSLLDATVMGLGCLWMLAPAGWRPVPPALRLTALLLPFVFLQWCQTDTIMVDQGRMLGFTLPCVVPLFLASIDRLSPWRWWPVLLFGMASLTLDAWTPWFAQLSSTPWTSPLSNGLRLLLVLSLGAICLWLRGLPSLAPLGYTDRAYVPPPAEEAGISTVSPPRYTRAGQHHRRRRLPSRPGELVKSERR